MVKITFLVTLGSGTIIDVKVVALTQIKLLILHCTRCWLYGYVMTTLAGSQIFDMRDAMLHLAERKAGDANASGSKRCSNLFFRISRPGRVCQIPDFMNDSVEKDS